MPGRILRAVAPALLLLAASAGGARPDPDGRELSSRTVSGVRIESVAESDGGRLAARIFSPVTGSSPPPLARNMLAGSMWVFPDEWVIAISFGYSWLGPNKAAPIRMVTAMKG